MAIGRATARHCADDIELHPVYIALAEGGLTEEELGVWLRALLVLDTDGSVNEPRAAYSR